MVRDRVLHPLSDALDRATTELTDLGRLGDRLELMVERLSRRHGIVDPELIAEAQAADLLSQRLAGVAAFVGGLAAATPVEVSIDILAAVSGLTMAEQARRLTGPLAVDRQDAPTGELTLFGD